MHVFSPSKKRLPLVSGRGGPRSLGVASRPFVRTFTSSTMSRKGAFHAVGRVSHVLPSGVQQAQQKNLFFQRKTLASEKGKSQLT